MTINRGGTEGPYFDKVVKCQNPKIDSVKLMFGLHKNAFIFVLALFKNHYFQFKNCLSKYVKIHNNKEAKRENYRKETFRFRNY